MWRLFLFLVGMASAQMLSYQGSYGVGHFGSAIQLENHWELNPHWRWPLLTGFSVDELGFYAGTGFSYVPRKTMAKLAFEDYTQIHLGLYMRSRPPLDPGDSSRSEWKSAPWIGFRLGRKWYPRKEATWGVHLALLGNWVANDLLARRTTVFGMETTKLGSVQVGFQIGLLKR